MSLNLILNLNYQKKKKKKMLQELQPKNIYFI